jgi:hypothetical protein
LRLAVEHTLVEFFPGERDEFARFERIVAPIQNDAQLVTTHRIVYIDVPRQFLPKGTRWLDIGAALREWLTANIEHLPNGDSLHDCIPCRDAGATEFTLKVNVIPDDGWSGSPIIRRYGEVDVPASVEKALRQKIPKLIRTVADRRVLMLERNQFRLDEREILRCVELQLSGNPDRDRVAVWLVETVFYDGAVAEGWRGFAEFKRYVSGDIVESFAFNKGVLWIRRRGGSESVLNPLPEGE